MRRVLIVDDDPEVVGALERVAKIDGYEPVLAGSVKEARAVLRHQSVDIVFLDLMLPDGTGLDLVDELEVPEVIMVTGSPSIDSATMALRYRFRDYLTKPVDLQRIRQHLADLTQQADEAGAPDDEAEEAASAAPPAETKAAAKPSLAAEGEFPLVGECETLQSIDTQLAQVAPTDAPVLIVGESGTGKELTAQTLHERSERRDQPFVPINCGAIPETLIESELFGHVKGAFTGADRDRRGVFERANTGTLFLDEVTEMPLEMQVRLLRVLEESKLRRVGSEDEIELDVRIVAATNRDPAVAIQEGQLREDLYYRLCVFQIQLPPLRDRGNDVEVLANAFLEKFNEETGTAKKLNPTTITKLQKYSWPGNVRQLKNALYHAFILAQSSIDPEHLPPLAEPETPSGPTLSIPANASIAEAEERMIRNALERFDGDKKRAGEALGISERTLYNRLKQYRERGVDI